MPRATLNEVPQAELVLRLRLLLDEAMKAPPTKSAKSGKARVRLHALVEANPESVGSSHVMHNIGKERREWLLEFLAKEMPAWHPR